MICLPKNQSRQNVDVRITNRLGVKSGGGKQNKKLKGKSMRKVKQNIWQIDYARQKTRLTCVQKSAKGVVPPRELESLSPA